MDNRDQIKIKKYLYIVLLKNYLIYNINVDVKENRKRD